MQKLRHKLEEEYAVGRYDHVNIFPDPLVRGMYAVRVQSSIRSETSWHMDFLWDSEEPNPDYQLEEVEFKTWPPKSSSFRFFL